MWIEGRAVYREAEGATARPVTITLDVRGLTVRSLDGEALAGWPFGRLIRLAAPRGTLAIGRRDAPGRIEMSDPGGKAAFEAALKAIPREGQSRVPASFFIAAAVVAGLVTAAVALLLWGLSALTVYAAPLVPDGAVAMLDASAKPGVLAELGTRDAAACTSPAGREALDRLVERLADAGGARPMRLDVGIYRSDVPNALALPGGTIVVTDALLGRAGNPDAFAGVLAHEIGHVHHRHGVAQVLHQGGLTLAFGLLVGEPTGILADATRVLVGADYSREAEREADRFAVGAVAVAGGDAAALGPLLEDLQGDGNGVPLAILSTHPMSAERRASIDAMAADRSRARGRVMSPEDWAALKGICGGG